MTKKARKIFELYSLSVLRVRADLVVQASFLYSLLSLSSHLD